MSVEPRELRPSELVAVADKLAEAASLAAINPQSIILRLDVADAGLDLHGSAKDVWLKIVRAIYAGASEKAGFRSDAIARLIGTMSSELRGNAELSALAYQLGAEYEQQTTSPSIFLSYAHTDQADVDRLYGALQKNNAGIELFQDHRSINLGQEWWQVIRERAGQTSLLVCWVTSSYLKSAFCNYEIGIADSRGASILPIFIGPRIGHTAPSYLSQRQAIVIDAKPKFKDIAKQLTTLIN